MKCAPIFLLLLLACASPGDPASDTNGAEALSNTVPSDLTGYYDGKLPCADCSGIATQLWVRSDSTFVLRRHYLDRDTLAYGTVGKWSVADGQVELYDQVHVIRRLQPTANGLMWPDEDGSPFDPGTDHTLARLGDALANEIPRMRLSGSFTYQADAMSFRPCGSARNWPCAGAREWTDEGERLGSMGTQELQDSYLKSVKEGGAPWVIEVECSVTNGPAMEGDGTDEYIFIHRVLRSLEPGQCP